MFCIGLKDFQSGGQKVTYQADQFSIISFVIELELFWLCRKPIIKTLKKFVNWFMVSHESSD
jgi:hypothetical protein